MSGRIGQQIDDYTMDLIRKEEGFRADSYVDASGRSIGYGHFIKKGEEHLLGKKLTKAEAEDLLAKDIHAHQKGWIEQAYQAGLSRSQIATLTSFAYNTGGKAVPEIIRRMKMGDAEGAGKLLTAYNKSYNPKTKQKELDPVLIKRRQRELISLLAPLGQEEGSIKQFLAQNIQDISRTFKNAANNLGKKLSNIDFSFGNDSASAQIGSGREVILNQNKSLVAELSTISDTLTAMAGTFDDSAFLAQLRKEGANTYG